MGFFFHCGVKGLDEFCARLYRWQVGFEMVDDSRKKLEDFNAWKDRTGVFWSTVAPVWAEMGD